MTGRGQGRSIVRETSASIALMLAVATGVALASGCEPLPEPFPRIVEASPSGTVSATGLRVEFVATEPLDRADVLGGARIALCNAEDLREVKRLAESGGPLPAERIIASRVDLEEGGRRAVIVPAEPLVPGFAYAAILAHGLRAADGRIVLDPEGRPRSVVVEFIASAELDRPVRAEITKVLADADAPEAGGEYVEIANLDPEPLDLAGFRLAKRGPTGAFTRCTILRREGVAILGGSRGVVVGGAYDGRYNIPPGGAIYECGASAVAGGLANDRPPALLLEAPSGATVSSIGVASLAPRCAEGALVRLDAAGLDVAENLACSALRAPASAELDEPREGAGAP